MRQRVQMQIRKMMEHQDEVAHASVRSRLAYWGRWWRRRENARLGYPSVSPSFRLIELARVGCEVQRGRKTGRSDEINVPHEIQEVDSALEALPPEERAALSSYYVRGGRRRTPALRQAEIRVGQELNGP